MSNKFIRISLIVWASIALFACDSESSEPELIIDPVESNVKDLSADGMANCYIVTEPGLYKFKADNQFNLGEDLPEPPQISPVSACLIWQTVKGSLEYVELDTDEDYPYIWFEVAEAKGNALIAACDENGEIVWSWHIWMPETEITSVTTSTGYEVMNMNLGAMNNTAGDPASYGFLYQWGRKDPFPASATLTGNTSTVSAPMFDMDGNDVRITNSSWVSTENNTIEYSIAHPTVCLSNYSQYATTRDWLKTDENDDALWGNPDGDVRNTDNNTYTNKGKKTCYDPSPLGWRVAPPDAFRDFTTSGGYAWTPEDFNVSDRNNDGIIDIDDFEYGWHFIINDKESLYFPAASRFDGSYAMLMGSMSGLWGNYWSNAPYSTMKGGGFCALAFQVKDQNGNEMITISPSAAGSKADAYSIRCIRDN